MYKATLKFFYPNLLQNEYLQRVDLDLSFPKSFYTRFKLISKWKWGGKRLENTEKVLFLLYFSRFSQNQPQWTLNFDQFLHMEPVQNFFHVQIHSWGVFWQNFTLLPWKQVKFSTVTSVPKSEFWNIKMFVIRIIFAWIKIMTKITYFKF